MVFFQSVQSLSPAWLFETPWTAARQASLPSTFSFSVWKVLVHLPAYTILVPHQGPNPLPLPWECGVQTTGLPGTSLNSVISSSLSTSQISSKVRCWRKEESISFTLWSWQVYRSLYKENNVFVLTKCPLDLNSFFFKSPQCFILKFLKPTKCCNNIANTHISFREGNGTPLQYSCLENLLDEGAW